MALVKAETGALALGVHRRMASLYLIGRCSKLPRTSRDIYSSIDNKSCNCTPDGADRDDPDENPGAQSLWFTRAELKKIHVHLNISRLLLT